VAPPFRTPICTVTDQLLHHVEAHAGRAVRLCAGGKLLRPGDALPEDGVVVATATPHMSLFLFAKLRPEYTATRRGDGTLVCREHLTPITVLLDVVCAEEFHGVVRVALDKTQHSLFKRIATGDSWNIVRHMLRSETLTLWWPKARATPLLGARIEVVVGFHYIDAKIRIQVQ
jgi:hypothetical protein